MKRMRIALIAHDVNKDSIVAFVERHGQFFSHCELVATASTCGRLNSELGVVVTRVQSGPLGGDLQIGAQLAAGDISAVFFLRDPLTAMPHEADIAALLRLCDVYNIPCATNMASAELMIRSLKLGSTPQRRYADLCVDAYGHPSDASHVMEQVVPNRDDACVLELLGQRS